MDVEQRCRRMVEPSVQPDRSPHRKTVRTALDPDQPEGSRGSEGCQYLAYVPGEMVAFTWNAPPHLALREAYTWVVITFTKVGDDSTEARLAHTGFLEGPEWDAYMGSFEDA